MVDIDRNKIALVFLGILVLVAVGVVLKYAASVILPLIIAWLFSFLIGPVVNYMTQRKVPTTLAVFIILILLLGVNPTRKIDSTKVSPSITRAKK